MERELKDELTEIEKYCNEQKIPIYPTEAMDIDLLGVTCIEYKGDNWKSFLDTFKACEAKLLIISVENNDLQTDDDITIYKQTLQGDDLKAYNQALRIVESKQGQLLHFQLNFFVGEVNYYYRKEASWMSSHDLVFEAYDYDDEDEPEHSSAQLTDSEIDELARKLLKDSKYLAGKDRFERERIANNSALIKGMEEHIGKYRVARKAEEIFEQEVQPVLDKELSEKIQQMKKKGLKKIEVKSQLKIGDATLNKFWYEAS